jgi:hypothetical protein
MREHRGGLPDQLNGLSKETDSDVSEPELNEAEPCCASHLQLSRLREASEVWMVWGEEKASEISSSVVQPLTGKHP